MCNLCHGAVGQFHGCTRAAEGMFCTDLHPEQDRQVSSTASSIFGHQKYDRATDLILTMPMWPE